MLRGLRGRGFAWRGDRRVTIAERNARRASCLRDSNERVNRRCGVRLGPGCRGGGRRWALCARRLGVLGSGPLGAALPGAGSPIQTRLTAVNSKALVLTMSLLDLDLSPDAL